MTPTEIRAKLADLPPELAPSIEIIAVEATGAEEVAFAVDWRERRIEVEKVYQAWGESKGATTFLVPGFEGDNVRPSVFCFKENTGPEWSNSKAKGAPAGTFAAHPSKKPGGKALQAEINAMPPIPPRREVLDRVDPPGTIRYKTGKGGSGFLSICRTRNGHFLDPRLGWSNDRFFAVFVNPFAALADFLDTAERYPDHYPELRLDNVEIVDWRPPEGWALTTKAKMELVYAQAKVAEEEAKS